MNKYSFLLIPVLFSAALFVSCGLSAEEKEAEKIRIEDSTNAAQAAELAAQEAAIELAKSDSTTMADSLNTDSIK